MEWEKQEEENGKEFWIIGEKCFDEELNADVWTFLADVFIDKKKKRSEVEFDVFSFPRHIVEDSGWKSLRDAINDLRSAIAEMERIEKVAKKLKVKVFSDEFVGFKASVKINSINRKAIERKIEVLRKEFRI
jgi:hypothetical protein